MERRRNEVGNLTKLLRKQVSPAAVGSNELAAVYSELESHNAKADFQDEQWKVSRNEVAAIKSVGEK